MDFSGKLRKTKFVSAFDIKYIFHAAATDSINLVRNCILPYHS